MPRIEPLERRRLLAAGDLDLAYGRRGNAPHEVDVVAHALPAADGRVIVIGESGGDAAVSRRSGDGAADVSFGDAGITKVAALDVFVAGRLMPDGRIVVLGLDRSDQQDFVHVLARFTADGDLDTSFGDAGLMNLDAAIAAGAGGQMIAVQPNGGVLFQDFSDNTLYRITPDGDIDATFAGGAGGLALSGITGFESHFGAMATLPDNKILLGSQGGIQPAFRLLRLNPDGTRDNTFGTNGLVTTGQTISGLRPIGAIALLPDGRILTAGHYAAEKIEHPQDPGGVVLARFTAAGALDPTFSGDGMLEIATEHDPMVRDLVMLNGGGDFIVTSARREVSATRIAADGTVDAGFDDVAGRSETFRASVLTTTGDFLAVGDGMISRLLLENDLPSFVQVTPDGTLAVGGTNSRDRIEVGWGTRYGSLMQFDLYATRNGFGRRIDPDGITRIAINARDGNDTVMIAGPISALVTAGTGDDKLVGGNAGDVFYGGAGSDSLHGVDGNDQLFGQGDRDRLFGGNGADTLRGGPSADHLIGQGGDDQLFGDGGNDYLDGGFGGADALHGNAGDDRFFSFHLDGSADSLFGDRGTDFALIRAGDLLAGIEEHEIGST